MTKIGGVAGKRIEQEMMIELDSHADTCVVSSDLCLITQDFERPVQVFAWDGTTKKGSTNKTVSDVVAYDLLEYYLSLRLVYTGIYVCRTYM